MSESSVTKRALAAALRQLMLKKPLEKVTVGDICEACGMSRKGFYYHFKDKYDLVNWIFYSEFVVEAQKKNYQTSWVFFSDICTYFYENRAFYTRAFQVEGQNSFASYFVEQIQPAAERYFERTFEDGQYAHFYSVFFTDAFQMAIIRWLRENASIEPKEFIELLHRAASSIAERITAMTDKEG